MTTAIRFLLLSALALLPSLASAQQSFTNFITNAPALSAVESADLIPVVRGSATNNATVDTLIASLGTGLGIKSFGCALDGTTDDTGCALAATAWLKTTGGPLWQTPGTMLISQTLDISAPNIRWQCLMGGSTVHNASGLSPSGCVIKWSGSAPGSGYMITDIAPSGSTSNGVLQGQHVIGLSLDGAGVAAGGIHFASIWDSEFGQLYCTGFNGGTGAGSKPCFNFDVVHKTTGTFGDACDNVRLNIYDIIGDQAAYTSDVVQYNGWINSLISNGGCGNSYNTITRLSAVVNNSDIFAGYGGDNNRFIDIIGGVLGSGHMANINVASNIDPGTSLPVVNGENNEIFDKISAGPVTVAGTGAGCVISPGSVGACPYAIRFTNLDGGNNQPAPTLGTGVRQEVDVYWDYVGNDEANSWAVSTFTQANMPCSGGTLTTATGTMRSRIRSKVFSFSALATISSIGTCSTFFQIPLPSGVIAKSGGLTQQGTGYDQTNGQIIPNIGAVATGAVVVIQPTTLGNAVYRVSGSFEID